MLVPLYEENSMFVFLIQQVLSCLFSQSASLQKAYKGKIYSSADDAVADIPNGAKLLVGGFGRTSRSFKRLHVN
jgi:methyl coenzyme M reductase subunit C-like uncharacterized protein (methanogenesis marker protein 7)